MAKPKNETPAVEEIATEAPAVEAPAVEAAPSHEDKLVAALNDMDHRDDMIWNTDGSPSAKYLSDIVGEPVTPEEVTELDPTFKRAPLLESKEDVVLELPPEQPKPRVFTHDDLKAVDAEWAEALAKKAEAEKALKAVEAKRDPIVNALAHNPSGQSFAHVVQEMQKRTMESSMQRVAHLKQFKEMTGGALPSAYPSKLDERAATRRTVQRRAARDAG